MALTPDEIDGLRELILIERYTDHRSEEEKRAELDALVDELVRRQNRHAP